MKLKSWKKKLTSIEEKINAKLDILEPITFQISQTGQRIESLRVEKQNINASLEADRITIQDKIAEEKQLMQTINRTQADINRLPTSSYARRTALRENMRAKKALERVQATIISLQQNMAPAVNRMAAIDSEIQVKQQLLLKLESDKVAVENEKPTLASLNKIKERTANDLLTSDQTQQQNLVMLDEAQEKVLMCKTYNVKYPIVLDVAREIKQVGCHNYQLRNLEGRYAQDAETEAIDALCGTQQ
jgi:chromosome segregation ATPase